MFVGLRISGHFKRLVRDDFQLRIQTCGAGIRAEYSWLTALKTTMIADDLLACVRRHPVRSRRGLFAPSLEADVGSTGSWCLYSPPVDRLCVGSKLIAYAKNTGRAWG